MKLTYLFHTAYESHWWIGALIGVAMALLGILLQSIGSESINAGRRLTIIPTGGLLLNSGICLVLVCGIFGVVNVKTAGHTSDETQMVHAITSAYKVEDVQVTNKDKGSFSVTLVSLSDHKPYTCRFRPDTVTTKQTKHFPSFDKLKEVDGTLFCDKPAGTLERNN